MHKQMKWIVILVFPVVIFMGCASKKVMYATTGALIGAGGGYAINQEVKDAAIGGLSGGIAGGILADISENKENRKFKEGYDQGYTQAQLETAIEDWNRNTGKREGAPYYKSYQRIKIPKKEINDVIYESHYEILETYR